MQSSEKSRLAQRIGHTHSLRSSMAFFRSSLLILFSCFVAKAAISQKLPPPAREVYKCQEAGKVIYSDSPCLGAEKIDTEPTRGLNKSSGKELTGKDVQREHRREITAEALKPLTGLDAKQLDQQGRRMKLNPESQKRCQLLDHSIPMAEREERSVQSNNSAETKQRLFSMRTEFRSLGCQ